MSRARMCAALLALALTALGACGPDAGLNRGAGGVYAPGVAPGRAGADPIEVGHRLMEAGQFQLALDAYMRAAAREGLTVDTLSALGSANLRLGRLNQAEDLLRRAVAEDAMFVPAWNNLGVLLMEQGKPGEASEAFRRAYAAADGGSDTIRDNLRLSLARMEDPFYAGARASGAVSFNDVAGEARLVSPSGAGAPSSEEAPGPVEAL